MGFYVFTGNFAALTRQVIEPGNSKGQGTCFQERIAVFSSAEFHFGRAMQSLAGNANSSFPWIILCTIRNGGRKFQREIYCSFLGL